MNHGTLSFNLLCLNNIRKQQSTCLFGIIRQHRLIERQTDLSCCWAVPFTHLIVTALVGIAIRNIPGIADILTFAPQIEGVLLAAQFSGNGPVNDGCIVVLVGVVSRDAKVNICILRDVFGSTIDFTTEPPFAIKKSFDPDVSVKLVVVITQSPLDEILHSTTINTHFDVTNTNTLVLITIILGGQREADAVNALHDSCESARILQVPVGPGYLA